MKLDSIDQLTALFPAPTERAVLKEQTQLDKHAKHFVALSPFLVISTVSASGKPEASPRGGRPGFVQVNGPGELLIPDSPGNNRLDSLRNVIETGKVGLLFFLPGIQETLRVNGHCTLSNDEDLLARFADESREPKLVLRVEIEVLFMHCAKALIRSRLWDQETQVERADFPTMGQILKDQIGGDAPPESYEDMLKRYAKDL